MIPELSQIKKRSRPIQSQPFFQLVDEYKTLQKRFVKPFFEGCVLFFDMILYPLFMIIQMIQEISPMHILSLIRTYELWSDFFRYQELHDEIHFWMLHVKRAGGPWISTNDPEYHLYVYADGMERISLAWLPKELTKGSK